MTERERWIVYPLLFLALGAALRDKLFDRTTTKSIVCQELMVVEEAPVADRPVRVLARIGRTEAVPGAPAGGYLILNGQLSVDGVVNAKQYAYQGVPFVPSLRTLPTGVSWADVLQAMQQAAQVQQQSAAQEAAPPSASAPAEPLADPDENR
jgi:hypothetical protein